jgi:ArsR family transcriptional regulator
MYGSLSLHPDFAILDTATLSSLFKSIGDPVRLRVLHLLSVEELSVGELVRVLGLPQSSVSRHLKVLREQGLVADRPVGAATYYRATLAADVGNGDTALRDTLAGMMTAARLAPADRDALERVAALREMEDATFFDRIGIHWDALREECFGETFHLEALIHLLPAHLTVADLGTGTGYMLPALGRHFAKVIGVDNSAPMIDLARRRAEDSGAANIELRRGSLEELPLRDGEIDIALLILMLHHLGDVEAALREVRRALAPGGRTLIVEIHPHDNEPFRVRMADRRSGVAPAQLEEWLRAAGFDGLRAGDFSPPPRPDQPSPPVPRLYCMVAERSRDTEKHGGCTEKHGGGKTG